VLNVIFLVRKDGKTIFVVTREKKTFLMVKMSTKVFDGERPQNWGLKRSPPWSMFKQRKIERSKIIFERRVEIYHWIEPDNTEDSTDWKYC